MNSTTRDLTVRVNQDPRSDHVSAFRTALDLFGTATLSEFLPLRDHDHYLETLFELVCLEMAHGWKVGAPVPVENYRVEYPELFEDTVYAYRILEEDFRLRENAGEFPATEAITSLDPNVSSKFDIAMSPEELANYSATVRVPDSDPSIHWPSAEIGQTQLGLPADRRFSDPEIVWKLNEALLDLPKVGDDFLGFSLLAELGKGAFGKVFLAQQGQLAGRLVALKIAAGLFTESQTLAQLQHSYIVPIYSYHHGKPFQAVCMPYLGSTTLAHILADLRTHKNMPSSGRELLSAVNSRRRARRLEDSSRRSDSNGAPDPLLVEAGGNAAPLDAPVRALELEGMSYVDSILWMAVRLADGLAHAHERRIIHRDLKPANILLTDDGVPMLLDFNLAQDNKTHGSAAAASIGGTLPYMAPEHLEAFRGNSGHVDARSDIYSLGVILFELLTGVAPFPAYRKMTARDTVSRMIQDRHEGVRPLRLLNKSIPPAVEAIVRRCLAADPAQRYQTARQLQEDLQAQLDHEPLKHAANPSLWERCQKFRRRHPRLTSVTTVIVIAGVLMASLASAFAVREDQHRRLEAKATLTRFQDDAETAYFLLSARTAKDQLDDGQRACRSTLAHYRVLENPEWRESAEVLRLSDDERNRLNADVGQLLVLLAHAQQLAGERETDPARRQARLQEGLQFCSVATDCFPNGQVPQALWKQQGELHRRLDQRDQARHAFNQAGKSDYQTAQDRYLAARLLAEEGNFRAALPLVKDGIRLRPQDFNLHFLQGICHDYLAQHAEAIACYRACIALRPKFYGAYYNRGLSYLRYNDFKSAIADFDDVVRLQPDHAEVYAQRALALHALDKNADAIADLTEALERGIGQTRIYFLRSKVRAKAGDADGAKKDFAEGLRREPTDEQSWIARGIAWLPAEPKRALADFEKALELEPRSLAALHNKAHVLGKYFKRTEEAVKTLDIAVGLYPDDVRPRAGRGVYLARLGKRDAAIADAEHALSIDASPAIAYEIAGIYALTSRTEPNDRHEAMRLLSVALKKGFGFDYLEIDHDLDPIREIPAFRKVIEGARALRAPTLKSS